MSKPFEYTFKNEDFIINDPSIKELSYNIGIDQSLKNNDLDLFKSLKNNHQNCLHIINKLDNSDNHLSVGYNFIGLTDIDALLVHRSIRSVPPFGFVKTSEKVKVSDNC